MEWSPYGECCAKNALDDEALRCAECGHLLLRCAGFARCFNLLAPLDHCDRCVAPGLRIPRGARLSAKVGEVISVPLELRNASPADATLRVHELLVGSGDADLRPVPLGFERLRPGEVRELILPPQRIEAGGMLALRLVFVFSRVFGAREEFYAFEGLLSLEGQSQDEQRAVQIINVSGSGSVVATGPSASKRWESDEPGAALDQRVEIRLARAERHERENGLRGLPSGVRIPRSVNFGWSGLPEGEGLPEYDEFPFLRREALRCGRNGRNRDHDQNPKPNEVCLRVYDRITGQIDRAASMEVSGRHLSLSILNDRLELHSLGRGGCWHNDRLVEPGQRVSLADGDLISPLAPGRRALRFRIRIVAEADLARSVLIDTP